LKITLKDFIKIFKSDKVSDNLVKIINNEVMQSKLLGQSIENVQQEKAQPIFKPPSQITRHPSIASPINNSLRGKHQKITLSYKTVDQKKIVEIPLDRALDQIAIHQNVINDKGHSKIKT
jgi:hypothetical protein